MAVHRGERLRAPTWIFSGQNEPQVFRVCGAL